MPNLLISKTGKRKLNGRRKNIKYHTIKECFQVAQKHMRIIRDD